MTKIYLMVADEQDINPATGQFKKAKGVELTEEELEEIIYYREQYAQFKELAPKIRKVLQCLKKQ